MPRARFIPLFSEFPSSCPQLRLMSCLVEQPELSLPCQARRPVRNSICNKIRTKRGGGEDANCSALALLLCFFASLLGFAPSDHERRRMRRRSCCTKKSKMRSGCWRRELAGMRRELHRRTSSSQKKRKQARTFIQVNVVLIGMSRATCGSASSRVLCVLKS